MSTSVDPSQRGSTMLLRAAAALLAACAIVASAGAEAQVADPRVRYRTLRSEHFELHYHTPLGVVARRALALLEDAHARLVPVMGHEPEGRTQVLLTDASEGANGSATALPVNTIRLFATAPGEMSALSDYDDWLATLIIHEHTHILHLDNTGGIPALVNAILGKVWAPNHLLPRFITEGIATHEESDETSGGRLRSTQFEMYVRMAFLEDNVPRLDQLTNGIDQWPHGNVAYLYGSRFMDYVADRFGRESMGRFAREVGRRAIPYGVNRAMRRATGHTVTELWDEFYAAELARHEARRDAVVDAGLSGGTPLTDHGRWARMPQFAPDGSLYYVADDGQHDNAIRRLAPDGSWEQLARVAGFGAFDITPEGDFIAESVEGTGRRFVFYDLFEIDGRSGRRRRLTRGLRARYPTVSPDGEQIAFVVQGAGTSHLVIGSRENPSDYRMLHRSARYDQVYTPRFSPDGRRVAFSVWEAGGYRDIVLVDVETGEERRITHTRALDMQPTFSPDGRDLYFTSDRSGVANIYRYRLSDGALTQMTNVVGGAYMPDMRDGRLVYVGYSSLGFDVHTAELDALRPRVPAPYSDGRPPAGDYGGTVVQASRRYRAYRTLFPRTYGLGLESGTLGTELSISLSGRDIAGFYDWSLRFGVYPTEGYPNVLARFRIRRTPIPIDLGYFRGAGRAGGLVVGGRSRPWERETQWWDLGTSYSFPRSFRSASIFAGYRLQHTRKLEPFGGALDPNDPAPIIPYVGFTSALRAGFSYSDTRRRAFDYTPSRGRAISASVRGGAPATAHPFPNFSANWSIRRYVALPWVAHHVFAFRYAGGVSQGRPGRRRLFFVGGFPEVDPLDQVLNPVMQGGVGLRGYAPFSRGGTRFQLLQAEYRLPFGRPQVGPATLPIYLRRVWGSVFADVGDAYVGNLGDAEFRVGAGAEVYVDFTLGYYLDLRLRVGGAYGFHDRGGARWYAHLGTPF